MVTGSHGSWRAKNPLMACLLAKVTVLASSVHEDQSIKVMVDGDAPTLLTQKQQRHLEQIHLRVFRSQTTTLQGSTRSISGLLLLSQLPSVLLPSCVSFKSLLLFLMRKSNHWLSQMCLCTTVSHSSTSPGRFNCHHKLCSPLRQMLSTPHRVVTT